MQRIILWISLSILAAACGIPLGGGTSNDAVPPGSIVAQATITGASGKTANGSAIIYLNGSVYTLRLQGLSVESGNGLQVVVNTKTGVALRTALRSTTGNQNYVMSGATGGFDNVEIFSTATQSDFAQALFPPPSS